MSDFSSILNLRKEEIIELIEEVDYWTTEPKTIDSFFNHFSDSLRGKILVTIFLSKSIRTKTSFTTAFLRMGGNTVSFSEFELHNTSEGWKEIGGFLSQYVDIIVMRSNIAEYYHELVKGATVPVISAGHGLEQHPTTAINHLHSIHNRFNTLENLNCVFVAKMPKRCINTLVLGLLKFGSQRITLMGTGNLNLLDTFKSLAIKTGSTIEWLPESSADDVYHKMKSADIVVLDEGEADYKDSESAEEPAIIISADQVVHLQNNCYITHMKPVIKTLTEDALKIISDQLKYESRKSYLCRAIIMKKYLC